MKYKTATEYTTYKEYCKARKEQGLQVIPESLWTELKNTLDIEV